MSKYRVDVTSYVVIEAEELADAQAEVEAARSGEDTMGIGDDLLSNCVIENVTPDGDGE